MIYIHKGDDTDFNDNSFLTFNIVTEKDLTNWQAKFILNGLEKTFEDITSKSFELHYSDEETSQFKLGKTTNELRLIDEEGKIKTVAKNIEISVTNEVIENESQLINLPILKDEGIDINISLASNSGGGGTANHFELLYRDMANQHPIKAITNLQETLDSKATKNEIPTKTSQLTNDSSFATESFVTNKIAEAELGGEEVDLSGLATKDDLNAKADKTELHSHSNKSVLDGITSQNITNWTNKSDFDGNYNSLTNKPTIPSKTSQLTNDSGYLTQHQDISNLATKGELGNKQDILVSGTNIKTINNQSILGEGNITIVGGEGTNTGGGSAFSLFDTKITDYILDGNNAVGWALQGTYVSGALYPDFYNKCLEEYQEAKTKLVDWIQPANPTGVTSTSGFKNPHNAFDGDSSSYAECGTSTDYIEWDLDQELILSGFNAESGYVDSVARACNVAIYSVDKDGVEHLIANGTGAPTNERGFSSATFAPVTVTKLRFKLIAAAEGKEPTTQYPSRIIQINLIARCYPTFVQNPNGHKFYSIEQKSIADEIYNQYGIADYYGIDEENERVFLPRNKWFAIINSDGVETDENKYLYYCVGNTEVTNAITNVTEITESENDSNPLGSSFYFNNIQPNAGWLKSEGQWNSGNIYKTFYNWLVDEKTTNTLRTDIKDVSEEYTDFDYVLNQDEMTFRLPLLNGDESLMTQKYDELTLGASGESYIAPANGWFATAVVTNASGQYVTLLDKETRIGIRNDGAGSAVTIFALLDVRKGQNIECNYTAGGKVVYFRFVYAQGNGDLYFKVANAVQNLELIDTGKVLEAVNNVIPKNSELIASYGMPSSKYVEFTLGASGSKYTSPVNGYCCLNKTASSSGQYIGVNRQVGGVTINGVQSISVSSGQGLIVTLPVKKGDIVAIGYNASGNVGYFRFVHAEGEV